MPPDSRDLPAVGAIEALEDPRQVLGRDAAAGVLTMTWTPFCRRRSLDRDAATLGSMTESILYQVEEDLLERGSVRIDYFGVGSIAVSSTIPFDFAALFTRPNTSPAASATRTGSGRGVQ